MIEFLHRASVVLRPDASRTVIRPFSPEDPPAFAVPGHRRAGRIADRITALREAETETELAQAVASLSDRHRDVEDMLAWRFADVADRLGQGRAFNRSQQLLIGAYLSAEFSFEAAALFNPSAVPHPDQSDLPDGAVRFALSLRGIGEGHVSSVTFRLGVWLPNGDVEVEPPSAWAVPPSIERTDGDITRLHCQGSRDLSETVLFPVTASQRQGVEDLRMVRFVEDDGSVRYLGTYTAFSGSEARSELLRAHDFRTFDMQPLKGSAASGKGMALFPRRIGGRYAMLGRQDNENVWFLTSEDLLVWEGGERIIRPQQPWEFAQMGNCGSPIEVDEGWLVLTHGVGMVRHYCVGACLLDKEDPTKVLARLAEPLLQPSREDRNGYVPNVVYTCGAMAHGRRLLIPYGVADNFAAFVTCSIDDLIDAMH